MSLRGLNIPAVPRSPATQLGLPDSRMRASVFRVLLEDGQATVPCLAKRLTKELSMHIRVSVPPAPGCPLVWSWHRCPQRTLAWAQ